MSTIEIKFRIWHKKPQEKMFYIELEKYLGSTGVIDPYVGHENGIWMQYTGLKDKSGKEIYEGDIVAAKFYPAYVERIGWKGEPDAMCQVVWDLCGFGWIATNDNDVRFPSLYDMCFSETKIIGNIHENPELIIH